MARKYYVYILTNKTHGTLYVGFTGNISLRIFEHKLGIGSQFTSRYKLKTLVYLERFDTAGDGILREKQLKRWHREWKINLIEKYNPEWKDLWDDFK